MSVRSDLSHSTPSVAAKKVTRAVMAADDSDSDTNSKRHKRAAKKSRHTGGKPPTSKSSASVATTGPNPLSRLEQDTLSQTISSAFKSAAADCSHTNLESCSSKSALSDTPTLSGGGTRRERGEGDSFKAAPHEAQETELERQLKQERRHLVFKLDDISQKHQAVLKANVELRKKVASLTAELEDQSNRNPSSEDDIVPKVLHNLEMEAMKSELKVLRSDKAKLEDALKAAKSSLSEARRGQREAEDKASGERESLRKEIQSLKRDKLELADEKDSLQTLAAVQKEKMDQLEKLTTKKEVANILKDKELNELKHQVDELTLLQVDKNLELDRLNDEVYQRREGQAFVEGTFKGLGQIVKALQQDNMAANQRHRKSLEDIAKFKSYMANNLYFDLEE